MEQAEHELIAKFSDLAVELEKHSNDHIHDSLPTNAIGAAVEGVCADRINAILKCYRSAPAVSPDVPQRVRVEIILKTFADGETVSQFATLEPNVEHVIRDGILLKWLKGDS